jgi:L-threonylcarbamoyladenylate synthase
MMTGKDIKLAGELIRNGNIVAFPTETVYGLGADVFNTKAVSKIFAVKERPSFDPLIVHIQKLDQLELLCKQVDSKILKLAEKFWPGPLTLVVEKSDLVPDIVTSGLNTIGIRMPAHAVALALIREAKTPLAAPSANKFGRISPTEPWHIVRQLTDIDYILDGGKSRLGIESTVIALINEGFVLLRPGAITLTELEKELPQIAFHDFKEGKLSPGLLKSHYSPRIPIFICAEYHNFENLSNAGLISFGLPVSKGIFRHVEILSENKNLNEAAVNLFSALHKMEKAEVDFIIAEPVPETGIGIAIMDRLKKAAHKYQANTHGSCRKS